MIHTTRDMELLAPGGDIDAIKAAIAAGADAIYCGLSKFNARNRATNIEFDELQGLTRLARQHGCKIFLTMNILIVESEIPLLLQWLNRISSTRIDAIIVQDLGLFYILKTHFPTLEVHASTQCSTLNSGQISFLHKLGASRVNLARELTIDEIQEITNVAHHHNMEVEVFVHGSYCISFSGLCYISSVMTGKSGNRGRCSQPCRDRCQTTPKGRAYPLNLKDNSAFTDIRALSDAGVDSLKIEGRIKGQDYVYTVVKTWREQIRKFQESGEVGKDSSPLAKVFNRDFSNGFLVGAIDAEMFIDNPRDHAICQLSNRGLFKSEEAMIENRERFYEEKKEVSKTIRKAVAPLDAETVPLDIKVSGTAGSPLTFDVMTPDSRLILSTDALLAEKGRSSSAHPIDQNILGEKLRPINESEFRIRELDLSQLDEGLFIPFKEITSLRAEMLFQLSGVPHSVTPVTLPPLTGKPKAVKNPKAAELCVLVDNLDAARDLEGTDTTVCVMLPNGFGGSVERWVNGFQEKKSLIPWFPAVLMGKDFKKATEILSRISPEYIVTENTGIAQEAVKLGIPWVAGPQLNLTNSYSLLCLKELFGCSGAFVSGELNGKQIRRITTPHGFRLFHSIYNPIQLMTSRQCLHQQVVGCHKSQIDDACTLSCSKASVITRADGTRLHIHKAEGFYHTLYNSQNHLNTEIPAHMPGRFDGVLVDLREIATDTICRISPSNLLGLFNKLLQGENGAEQALHDALKNTTSIQYKKGI